MKFFPLALSPWVISGLNPQSNVMTRLRLSSGFPLMDEKAHRYDTRQFARFDSNEHQPLKPISQKTNEDALGFPEGWLAIGLSQEVTNNPTAFNRFGLALVLWRDLNGQLNTFDDRCPHRSAKLSLGQITQDNPQNDNHLECPFHGLQFDSDGLCQLDPEDSQSKPFIRVQKYTTLEKNGTIWLRTDLNNQLKTDLSSQKPTQTAMTFPGGWWAIGLSEEVKDQPILFKRFGIDLVISRGADGQLKVVENKTQLTTLEKNKVIWLKWGEGDYPEPDYFKEFDNYYSCLLKITSKASFSLNVENQLDNSHVEFIHRHSFWPIAKKVMVDKQVVQELNSRGIRWHFDEPAFFWDLQFPNVWSNPRFDDYAMTLIYAPVDENTTDLYIRSHRKFLTQPIINQWVDIAIKALYYYITMEDQVVVLSQQDNDASRKPQRDKLYRKDDQSIRFFRSWVAGEKPLKEPLYDRPHIKSHNVSDEDPEQHDINFKY
jgi:phenylpropionate dioxygenase-like ring-hydroxylating dioxygenase large terminal subunit